MDKSRITIKLNQSTDHHQIKEEEKPAQQEISSKTFENKKNTEEQMTALEMEIRKANEIQMEREKNREENQNLQPEIELEEEEWPRRKPSRTKQPKVISWFASSNDHHKSKKTSNHSPSRNTISTKYKKKYSHGNQRNSLNSQLGKTIGVGIGAIATGILFGFILLHFFITPMMIGNDSIQTNTNLTEPGGTNGVVIPQKVVYFLQSGVFTDKTGAKTAVADLKKVGKAAVVKEGSPNHVFVGMAIDKTQGQTLVDVLKAGGQTTYLKPYTLKEYQSNMSTGTFQNFYSWTNTGDQMVQWLSSNSIALIKDSKATVKDQDIQKLHQQFLNEAQGVQNQLAKEGKTKEQQTVKLMADHMTYAITAFNEYRKTASEQYLWNVQNSLMDYELIYETLGQ
ncbi:hypothetical protein [Tepidibacillus marianensis]|uniref:SPOR domain-containing protein n=1 Tax=Tepidibacillus marianensis TaxID=3131995 RepID=UPI0030CD5B61